jgi:hypothetical protein
VANSDDDMRLIDVIQTYLEDHNWEPQSGEHWVDHTFENDHGVLHIDYSPPSQHLGLSFESEECEVELGIAFDGDPSPVLDVITRHQADLSEDTWRSFITALLASSPRVVEVAGDDGDDITVIANVEDGVAALRERDWEYYDENVHSPDDIINY